MKKFRLPKWANIVGAAVAVAPYLPGIQQAVPQLATHPLWQLFVTAVGVTINAYSTPPHANTVHGGVDTQATD